MLFVNTFSIKNAGFMLKFIFNRKIPLIIIVLLQQILHVQYACTQQLVEVLNFVISSFKTEFFTVHFKQLPAELKTCLHTMSP